MIALTLLNWLASVVLVKNEVAVERSATIHTKAEEQRMRVAVTIFVYLYGCFMAMYLSRYIRARCKFVALVSTVRTAPESCLIRQYVKDDLTCKITMFNAINIGCPITPMRQSVVAKHASAILDLVFNRGFVFTAIITSPFNKLVTGAVIVFMIIKITVTARASVVLDTKIRASHCRLLVVALKFILMCALSFPSKLRLFKALWL